MDMNELLLQVNFLALGDSWDDDDDDDDVPLSILTLSVTGAPSLSEWCGTEASGLDAAATADPSLTGSRQSPSFPSSLLCSSHLCWCHEPPTRWCPRPIITASCPCTTFTDAHPDSAQRPDAELGLTSRFGRGMKPVCRP